MSSYMSPIVLFVFNRPDHTEQTLKALQGNIGAAESELYIYSDAPRNSKDIESVKKVREVIRKFEGFKSVTIIERDKNLGLGRSVITGVTDLLTHYETVIVLEDDLITSKFFLTYMNTTLVNYKDLKNVYSVSGYQLPLVSKLGLKEPVFIPRISSWGWGVWKDRWNTVDWQITNYKKFINDKNEVSKFCEAGLDMIDMLINQVEGEAESWAIRFDYNRFINNALTIYPQKSFVMNIGMDGSGAHKEKSGRFDGEVADESDLSKNLTVLAIKSSPEITKLFREHYVRNYKSRLVIFLRRIGVYNWLKGKLNK